MNQQQQFDTALAGLTPAEQAAYKAANPTVGVGGVQQSLNTVGAYAPISPAGPMAINGDIINTAQPYNLPQPKTAPLTGNIAGSAIVGINNDANYTPPASATVDTAQSKVSKLLESIMPGIKSQATDIANIQNDAELLAKKQTAKNLSASIDQMDKDFRDEVATLKASGGTVAGIQSKIAEAQDRYQNRRANAALSYQIANNDYQGAQDIVNQKVQTVKDTNALALEAYKLQADSIFNDLSESEKITIQNNTKEKEKKAAEISDAYKATLDNLSSSGQNIPKSIFDAVDAAAKAPNASAASIYAAAGNYGVNLVDRQYKQAQIDKLNADNAKTIEETKALGGGGITNPEAAKYATALNTILGSSKFTKENKADVIRAVNNGEDPFQVIKNQARNLLGTEKTDLLKYEAAKTSMDQLDSQLKQFYAAGGKSNIFSGNFEKVNNKLGAVNDPALVDIAVQIAASLQKYRNAISGTAYSEQEGKDIASIFPGITKGELLNNTIVKARLKTLDSDIDGMYRSVLGSTYDTLKADVKGVVDSKTQVIEIGRSDPKLQTQIKILVTQNDPILGRPLTYDEVLQVLNQK